MCYSTFNSRLKVTHLGSLQAGVGSKRVVYSAVRSRYTMIRHSADDLPMNLTPRPRCHPADKSTLQQPQSAYMNFNYHLVYSESMLKILRKMELHTYT